MSTTYAIGRAIDDLLRDDPFFLETYCGNDLRDRLYKYPPSFPHDVLILVRDYERHLVVPRDDPRVIERLAAFDRLGAAVSAYQGSPAQAKDDEWNNWVDKVNRIDRERERMREQAEAARAYKEKYGIRYEWGCGSVCTG